MQGTEGGLEPTPQFYTLPTAYMQGPFNFLCCAAVGLEQ